MAESGSRSDRLERLAPAKLNLYLHVLGRREDGYHLLDSLVAFTAAGDRVSVRHSDRLDLVIDGPFAPALQNEELGGNLVWRAAEALAATLDVRPAAHITLTKRLPVASGIGGGSSDAAAALLLLAELWDGPDRGVTADAQGLGGLALGLGADVPMCLTAAPVLVRGIGERISPAPQIAEAGIVLVNPGVLLPTPAVFRARSGPFSDPASFAREIENARMDPHLPLGPSMLAGLLRAQRNDLEATAITLAPVIETVLRRLGCSSGCLLSRMSGSGSTCFGLYADEAVARSAAAEIAAAEPGWWCLPTCLAAQAPMVKRSIVSQPVVDQPKA